jgi:hypothetical protein
MSGQKGFHPRKNMRGIRGTPPGYLENMDFVFPDTAPFAERSLSPLSTFSRKSFSICSRGNDVQGREDCEFEKDDGDGN